MAVAIRQRSEAAGEPPKKAAKNTESPEPVIPYVPDQQQYRALQAQNLSNPNRVTTIPEGLPAQVVTYPPVWEGKEMLQNEHSWKVELGHHDVLDAERALRRFQASGLPPSKITRETFQLQPSLAEKLEKASIELHEGKGFVVFRGVCPEKYSSEENVLLFAGLMSYVGPLRGYHTPESNDVIAHVHDLTQYFPKEEVSSPTSTRTKMVCINIICNDLTEHDGLRASKPFHTDNADILALYVLNSGAEGGTFKIASTGMVYNDIAANRPDLIDALSKDYLFDCYLDNYEPYTRPLLFNHEGKLILQCFRRPFTGFNFLRRRAGLPGITPIQAEALDAIHFTAEKHCMPLNFRNGDIVLLHNFSVLHARDETDLKVAASGEMAFQKRHLLKMFLRDEDRAWSLPETLKQDWEILYGLRGRTKEGRDEKFRMTPQKDGKLSSGWVQNG